MLLDRYRLTDVAFKVVGISSVGTFCALGLFTNRDNAWLLLQMKEAQQSVLAQYTEPSVYLNQGQRVVTGQRIMQAAPDIFLGWTQEYGHDQYCYVRQLKDSRLAAISNEMADDMLHYHAVLCGRTLARAHARGGDAAAHLRLHRFRRNLRCGDRRFRDGIQQAGRKRLAPVRRGHQVRRVRGTQRINSERLLDAAASLAVDVLHAPPTRSFYALPTPSWPGSPGLDPATPSRCLLNGIASFAKWLRIETSNNTQELRHEERYQSYRR